MAQALQLDPARLVFVDESGFNLAMTSLYARALKGHRAYRRIPRNRGENTSLIAAMSLDEGVMAAMTLSGAVDSVAFELWLREMLLPRLHPGRIIVLDNLAVHKRRRVRELIEAKGCTPMFLPSYSPEFNPIELAFSKLKTFVRHYKARTRAALNQAIAAALKTITLQDVIAWFKHAGYSPHAF